MKKRQEERYYCVVRKNGEVIFQNLDGSLIGPPKAQHLAQSALNTINETVYVYLAKDPDNGLYKIGMSKNPKKRTANLGVQLLHIIPCTRFGTSSAQKVEKLIHEFLSTVFRHVDGEWFHLHGLDIPLLHSFTNGEQCAGTLGSMLTEVNRHTAHKYFPTPEDFQELQWMICGGPFYHAVAMVYTIFIFAHRAHLADNSALASQIMQIAINLFYSEWLPEKEIPQVTNVYIPTLI